jgi:Heparinase II/III-like protein/Heparinase II/III N-terminus
MTARLRRALRKSPRYLAWRAYDSAKRRSRRPWAYVYARLLTERALLSRLAAQTIDELWDRLANQPFFIAAAQQTLVASRFAEDFPDAVRSVVKEADAALRHEFDLLGSGPCQLGTPLPWHTDFKTGRQWPLLYCTDIEYNELDRPTDVKVPWELSRCQHFTKLGQAYWLTSDERYAQEFVNEVSDWIVANPLSYGVNWACAMDVALRAVSWVWAFYFFARSNACSDRGFRSRFLRSLFTHGEFIVKHLEKADLNGNHYLCDGVGLVFLGCLFREAPAAQRWLAVGRSIVEQEIFEQTTADGVDFEQSTAYHRLVLEGFLTSYELLRRNGLEPSTACWKRLEQMCEFVSAYTKPDGRAPLIGDADDGRVQILGSQRIGDHRYLLSYGAVRFQRSDFAAAASRCWEETFWLLGPDAVTQFAELRPPARAASSVAFEAGGFYVLRGERIHLIADCGEVGMRGRGGHGHNDILSFELALNGVNVVTDCGAYLYTASREWRNCFRSTAFHNSVQVDDEELNRFLGPDALWQLHYDAHPLDPRLYRGDCVDCFEGGHSGYTRLPSSVLHTRAFFVHRQLARVAVRDHVKGSGDHKLVWRFHLDPEITPAVDGTDVRLASPQGDAWLMAVDGTSGVTPKIEAGWVSPSYGIKVPAAVVVIETRAVLPVLASWLFADVRLGRDGRGAAVDDLVRAAGVPPLVK